MKSHWRIEKHWGSVGGEKRKIIFNSPQKTKQCGRTLTLTHKWDLNYLLALSLKFSQIKITAVLYIYIYLQQFSNNIMSMLKSSKTNRVGIWNIKKNKMRYLSQCKCHCINPFCTWMCSLLITLFQKVIFKIENL